MKNIAIITARSGSKGLPDKNIRLLAGKPLLAYSIEAAKESGVFDEVMVSTDSEQYAEIARKHGAHVPFLRSPQMSDDKASSWDTVCEALNNYLKTGMQFDTICLLQPTSPMRIVEDICNGYKLLEQKSADAITAVCEMDHSPLWSMTLPENLSLAEYKANQSNAPRQLLPQYYRINGALYIRRITYKDNEVLLQDAEEYAYIMPIKRSVDIDTIEDFEYAEWLLKK